MPESVSGFRSGANPNNNRVESRYNKGTIIEPDNLDEKLRRTSYEGAPIDALHPVNNKKRHDKLLGHINDRIWASQLAMQEFHPRWAANEIRAQAYIRSDNYEEMLKRFNDDGQPPQITKLVLPYSYSTMQTITAYLLHTFTGNRPLFPVIANGDDGTLLARQLEAVLQYNADKVKIIKQLYQFFTDMQIYGVSIMRTKWRHDTRVTERQRLVQPSILGVAVPFSAPTLTNIKEEKSIFQGTDIENVDPFYFLPDPTVAMADVNTKGEWCFWRSNESRYHLRAEEQAGRLKHIKFVSQSPTGRGWVNYILNSVRNRRSGGRSQPGDSYNYDEDVFVKERTEVIQGTLILVPEEWGLSPSKKPEKWMIAVGNGTAIIQCEPFLANHNRHPVEVAEPSSLGYGFGGLGLADYLAPIQDAMSWFLNSRIDNVRVSLNNMWLVDPHRVNVADILDRGPNKVVRLKAPGFGQDIRTAVQQLPVSDVTSGHSNDIRTFMDIGDIVSAVTDNLRGIQDSGGRKTATEVRTALEAASSRLAAMARLVSSQAVVGIAEQMLSNYQQYITSSFFVQITGSDGRRLPFEVTPEIFDGDFSIMVTDGTMPSDKTALLDVWRELLQGLVQLPGAEKRYDIFGVIEHFAALAGAGDLQNFRIDQPAPQREVLPDEEVESQAAAGNLVPLQNGALPQ